MRVRLEQGGLERLGQTAVPAGVRQGVTRWSSRATCTPNSTATTATAAAMAPTPDHASRRRTVRSGGGRRSQMQGCGAPGLGPGIDPRRDAVPDLRGRVDADVGDQSRHLPVLGHLGRAPWALGQMGADGGGLVGIDGIERERTQERSDLVVVHGSVHAVSTPCCASADRSRRSPLRIRLFTVPSGWPRIDATSR